VCPLSMDNVSHFAVPSRPNCIVLVSVMNPGGFWGLGFQVLCPRPINTRDCLNACTYVGSSGSYAVTLNLVLQLIMLGGKRAPGFTQALLHEKLRSGGSHVLLQHSVEVLGVYQAARCQFAMAPMLGPPTGRAARCVAVPTSVYLPGVPDWQARRLAASLGPPTSTLGLSVCLSVSLLSCLCPGRRHHVFPTCRCPGCVLGVGIMPVSLSISLSVCQPVCLSVCLPVCLSVCLSVVLPLSWAPALCVSVPGGVWCAVRHHEPGPEGSVPRSGGGPAGSGRS
jgi:hypothetical protein